MSKKVTGIDSTFDAAVEKAQNPAMTTADNPLVANYQDMKNEAVVERNMERLRTDARMRFAGRIVKSIAASWTIVLEVDHGLPSLWFQSSVPSVESPVLSAAPRHCPEQAECNQSYQQRTGRYLRAAVCTCVVREVSRNCPGCTRPLLPTTPSTCS